MINDKKKLQNNFESTSYENKEDFDELSNMIKLNNPVIRLTEVESGKIIIIEEPRFYAGRDARCSLRLNNIMTARLHAIFMYENNAWFIKATNALNGTSVNGVIIKPDNKYQLNTGDIIEFACSEKFIFDGYNDDNIG